MQPVVRANLHMEMGDMPKSAWPSVDVFIVTYTEPLYILEATLTAAVTMDYPAHLLTVHVLVRAPLGLATCVLMTCPAHLFTVHVLVCAPLGLATCVLMNCPACT